jgi:hypothetical protein
MPPSAVTSEYSLLGTPHHRGCHQRNTLFGVLETPHIPGTEIVTLAPCGVGLQITSLPEDRHISPGLVGHGTAEAIFDHLRPQTITPGGDGHVPGRKKPGIPCAIGEVGADEFEFFLGKGRHHVSGEDEERTVAPPLSPLGGDPAGALPDG